MSNLIQIKYRVSKDVFFEHKCPNNTFRKTFIQALTHGIKCFDNTDLEGIDLKHLDLTDISFRFANLIGASFVGSTLVRADFSHADLLYADFRLANLSHAILQYAMVCDACLSLTDLNKVDISDTDFYKSRLFGAKNIPYIPLACPSDGAFIGWKKVGRYLIKLEIPEDAKRCSTTTRKCRCSKAKVLAITDGLREVETVTNFHNPTIYTVGEMVYPDSFDEDRRNECSHGIHFFIDKQDAIDYSW